MHAVELLQQDHPTLHSNIRKTHGLTKSAVIATSLGAGRSMVVTMARPPDDYHLVHILSCGPRQAAAELSTSQVRLELRPTSIQRLHDTVLGFMDGEDLDALIEIGLQGRAPIAGRWSRMGREFSGGAATCGLPWTSWRGMPLIRPIDFSEVESGLQQADVLNGEGEHDDAYAALVTARDALESLMLQQRRRSVVQAEYLGSG